MRASEKTRRLTGLALLTAIIVVLQVVATFIKFGPVPITLALAPIIIGAALYGPKSGAYLGGVFGVVVLLACIMGWDAGGSVLWNANPFLTAVICLAKGALSGLCAGAVYRALSATPLLGSIAAGIVSPVVNTGLFCLCLALLFHDILVAWAGGTEVFYYILFGLTGINFLVELAVNLVLSTVIVRVVSARSHA